MGLLSRMSSCLWPALVETVEAKPELKVDPDLSQTQARNRDLPTDWVKDDLLTDRVKDDRLHKAREEIKGLKARLETREKSGVEVYELGAKVRFKSDGVVGRVHSVTIGQNKHVMYTVTWMSNGSFHKGLIPSAELELVVDDILPLPGVPIA